MTADKLRSMLKAKNKKRYRGKHFINKIEDLGQDVYEIKYFDVNYTQAKGGCVP